MIETSRLLLKPYKLSDIREKHVGWLNDPEVVRYSEQRHKQHTMETQHAYLSTFPADSRIWLISVKPESALGDIGTITAHIDANNKTANMGILIGEKDAWGLGYGTEAWRAVMKDLTGDVEKIEAGCMALNVSMMTLCITSGMILEGIRYHHFDVGDYRTHMMMYGAHV